MSTSRQQKAICSILFRGLFERKTTSFSLFAGPLDLPFRMWSSSSLREMTTKKGWVTPCWCIRNQCKFSTLAADSKSQLYIQRRIKGWLDKCIYPWEMSEDLVYKECARRHSLCFFFFGKKHQSYKWFRVCWKCSYSLMTGQLCCSLVDSWDNESIKLCFTQCFANVDKQHQARLGIWWECLYCNATHFAVWRMDDSYWTTANFEITADSFESCEP